MYIYALLDPVNYRDMDGLLPCGFNGTECISPKFNPLACALQGILAALFCGPPPPEPPEDVCPYWVDAESCQSREPEPGMCEPTPYDEPVCREPVCR
jgi:hypothetical protein